MHPNITTPNAWHNTVQTVDDNLRYRHSQFAYGDYDPPYVLYGMEVSREKLDTVLEFFEGRATIIEDFDEDNPDAERLIVGSDGGMYYTPDHYKTFVRIF